MASELRFSAAKLAAPRFKAEVEAWLTGFDVRPWPLEATYHYADIRACLERAGKPMLGVDLMIAAHAMAEGSVVITKDAREFLRMPGLAVEEWEIESPQ